MRYGTRALTIRRYARGPLCLLAWFCACSPLPAQITLGPNGTLTAETTTLRVRFNTSAVASIVNKVTGEEYVRQAGPSWLSLYMRDSLETKAMTHGPWTLQSDPAGGPGARIQLTASGQTIEFLVGIHPETDELILRIRGESATPGVQSVQWGIFGLDLSESRLLIPGQAGTYYDRNTTPELVGLDYPTHWESQFFVYESQRSHLLVYSPEAAPNFKRLNASRFNGNLDVGIEMFAVAPWDKATRIPELELRWKGFGSDWREAVGYYKSWWSKVGPRPSNLAGQARFDGDKTRSADDLSWVKDVRVVVTVRYLDSAILAPLAERVDAKRTLLYLVPWRKAGFDLDYPDYTPADDAKPFIDAAKELGFRIMLHANALGISETNPNYSRFRDLQLKMPTGQPVGWLWDLPEGNIRRVAYINPASSEYRQLFIESVRPAIELLKPDALHLDAGGTIQNDGNGLVEGMNTIQGLIRYQEDIQRAFPGLALGYESITEINAPFIQFAQRWSSNYPPHPLGTFLFGDQTRFFGFLDQPAPDEDEFTAYLRRYEAQGILPTAPVASREDLAGTRPRMERLLEQFRHWQESGFEPDWESDWDGAIFRYKSQDGLHTAEVREQDNVVSLKVDDETVYRRLRGVSSYETPFHIRNWPGYGVDRLVGLDPNLEYWLDDDVKPDQSLPHLVEVPSNVHITNQSFLHRDFAMFGFEVTQPSEYRFLDELPRAKKGTFYRGFGDFPVINGAVVATAPVLVGSRARNSALVMHPPYERILGGVVFSEFTVQVPDAPEVEFQFEVALADRSDRKLPALFAVWVDGEELWRDYYSIGQWYPKSIPLERWRGKTIRLRLIGGPSSNGNPYNAVTCWSNLRIAVSPRRPGAELTVSFPAGAPYGSSAARGLEPTGEENRFRAVVDVPERLVVFQTEPAGVALGDNLLDLPFAAFRQSYTSMPSPFSDEEDVVVRPGKSGGAELPKVLYIQPPTSGRIYASWAVSLPADAARLQFQFGLMDPPPIVGDATILYSGASFRIFVNGEQLFDEFRQMPGPEGGSVSLKKWAGKPVLIQLVVDAEGTAIFDWGFFSDVRFAGE